ncbi:ribbon-helix-helix domain-containing protein [Leptolyngbya sp. GB1-A1]|uniref:hypothetical protein n=1 Tax=Leptolyngbya sp. GB1-A1 TaxID=2933908 RepID=UPI00329A6A98
MAVRRKPNTVEEFINGGGTVPESATPSTAEDSVLTEFKTEPSEETIAITLRVPKDLLHELDAAAKKCRPRRSRNSWILEAIIEKLEQGE